jgi:hypothetical protein
MRAFEIPASQPALSQFFIQLSCMVIAWVSLWRYGVSGLALTGACFASFGLMALAHHRRFPKQACKLIVNKNGSMVASYQEQVYDVRLDFALCSTNQILLQARVVIDGHSTRQEWRLERTDNEAFWRSACQWVQWLSSQGETKKPQ